MTTVKHQNLSIFLTDVDQTSEVNFMMLNIENYNIKS